jgi:glutamine phosphoribosylpyrophosphate amidotransferase
MCGLVGIVGTSPVNQRIYDALTVLQHRGQDAAGIMTMDEHALFVRKDAGPVGDVLFQMTGGLRSGMGYVGCGSIAQLRTETEFVRISTAGLRESHPHDVTITREAPNYTG